MGSGPPAGMAYLPVKPIKLPRIFSLTSKGNTTMVRATYSIPWTFVGFMKRRVQSDIEDAIDRSAPIVTLEELYDGFKVDPDTKATLIKADDNAWFRHYRTYQLTLAGFNTVRPVPVDIRASLPRGYEVLTARSVFAPVFKFTQDWSILHYLVENIMPLIGRDQISITFPWMVDLMQEEMAEGDYIFGSKNLRFYQRHMINNANDRNKCDTCIKAMMKPCKSGMPLLPSGLREAALSGNRLYTQYRLLKQLPRRNIKDGDSLFKISPRMDIAFVPQVIVDAVNEMKEFQLELKQTAIGHRFGFGYMEDDE